VVSSSHTALDAVSSLALVLWIADQVHNDVVSLGQPALDAVLRIKSAMTPVFSNIQHHNQNDRG
jgi:hypothetical protein